MNVASDAIIDVTPMEVRKDKPKNRTKLLIAGAGAVLLLAAAGGGGAWWVLRDKGSRYGTYVNGEVGWPRCLNR